eukprot:s8327_g2.t1
MIRAMFGSFLAVCASVASAKLVDVVSDAYYINLAQATDRDQFMKTQLARLEQESGLRYHRFDAVSGKSDHSVHLMIEPFKAGPDPRLPERHGSKSIEALKAVLAAETSHLRLWEHIWHAPPASPFALILEDDARIPSKLEQRLEWLHKIPYDADMVMLGYYLMCYTDGNLTHPCKKGSEDYKDFVRIQKAVDMAGVQKALVRGPTRFAGAHAYLVKVTSIPRLLRHVQHIRDQVLGNSSVPLKMMGTDYATDFDEECRKYVRSPPTIQQAHDLYETQIPTRYWGLYERSTGREPDVHGNKSAFSPVWMEASLLALFAVLALALAHIRRVLPRELPIWSWSERSAELGPISRCDSAQRLVESGHVGQRE